MNHQDSRQSALDESHKENCRFTNYTDFIRKYKTKSNNSRIALFPVARPISTFMSNSPENSTDSVLTLVTHVYLFVINMNRALITPYKDSQNYLTLCEHSQASERCEQ